jgi:fucose permease
MAAMTAGYFGMTISVGVIAKRVGYAAMFIIAAVLMTGGLTGMALNPVWLGFLLSVVALGAGAGLLDGGLNAYGAAYFRSRDLNWLHAAYGVGATIGPSVMTPIVASELSWRFGYGGVAVAGLLMVLLFVYVRRFFIPADRVETPADGTPGESGGGSSADPASSQRSPRRTRWIIIGSLALFFFYTGLEVITGQWAYSLLTIGRDVPPAVAGPWVAGFYGALTVGRMLFGWISERVATRLLLQLNSAGAVLGVALVWIGTPDILAAIGLFLLGFSLAPIFPLLVGETPKRVGRGLSDHVVGAQVGAANLGVVTLVGVTGLGVELLSLEFVGFMIAFCTAVFVVCNEVVARAAAK